MTVSGNGGRAKPTPETLRRLRWALALAAKGFKILELRPGEKIPLAGRAWGVWATSDPDKIKAMFQATPNMHYGVCPSDGYAIIDLDAKKNTDGIASFEKLEAEHGKLPDTFKVKTRNGGVHIFLKVSEPVGNADKGFGGSDSGIDVRGQGGYVVGPGCYIKPDKWSKGDGLYTPLSKTLTFADAPEWVAERFNRPAHKDPKAGDPLCELNLPHNLLLAEQYLARREPAIMGDKGNNHTWETIAFLRDFGLSADMAYEMILFSDWNLNRCDPEWDTEELETLVRNVWAYPQNRPGCKRSALSRLFTFKVENEAGALVDIEPVEPENYRAWSEAEHAPPYGTEKSGSPVDSTVEKVSPFKLRSEAEQDAQPDIRWLMDRVIQAETSVLFYGPEDSLKSFLVLGLTLSAAAGVSWASFGGVDGQRGVTQLRSR